MKATEECFNEALIIIMYKVVLISQSVDDIPKCGHSNESY